MCFINIVIWTEVLFIQDVLGVYTSSFLDTDELKMTLRPEKFPGLSRNGPQVVGYNYSRDTIVFIGRETLSSQNFAFVLTSFAFKVRHKFEVVPRE